jgi:FkbM family methyltransferase
MSSLLSRLRARWRVIRAFAARGLAAGDRLSLARAGLARGRPFDGASLYARIGRLPRPVIAPRLRATRGGRVMLDLRDLPDLMIFEEIFVDGIYPMDAASFTPDAIFDCGACRGHFALLAHSLHPAARLELFEPEPQNQERIRANLALNRIRATVHPAAVGVSSGHARFSGSGFGGHILASGEPEDKPRTPSTQVAVVDLPALLRSAPPSSLWLKIDIEGAEESLLPALVPVLPERTVIWLETHHDEARVAAFLEPLLQSGFTRRIIRRRAGPSAEIEYVEQVLLRAEKT